MKRVFAICFVLVVTGFLLLAGTRAVAGIILDGTLGTSGEIPGPDYAITADLGTQVGDNLFHSFLTFNLDTGESALFSGPDTIENVIGRVTGGEVSVIDGLLGCEIPGADLYLINPYGLVFGENARLDVQGSFHASTADYLTLGDSGRFDATVPEASVLISAAPSAFGFLDGMPAGIDIDGSFLNVPEGESLSLIGGDLQLTNATLFAQSGRINIAAAGSSGEVRILENDLAMDGFTAMGDIDIYRDEDHLAYSDSRSIHDIDVDGKDDDKLSGSIYIRGGNLEVHDAIITAKNSGVEQGGDIDVDLSDDLSLLSGGQISSSTLGSGAAGNIVIHAGGSILVSGEDPGGLSSGILTNTYADGQGGKIEVTCQDLTLGEFARIQTISRETGGAGGIQLQVDSLELRDGGQISSSAVGDGSAGNIDIQAVGDITIQGEDPDGYNSGLYANTKGIGPGGQITVTCQDLTLGEYGRVQSISNGAGAAGGIDLTVENLNIIDGGQINSSAYDTGSAGLIDIHAAADITIEGEDPSGYNSGVYAQTHASGLGGDIQIACQNLSMASGGQVSSTTWGDGDAGDISISAAEDISILGNIEWFQGFYSPVFSGLYANTNAEGQGGEIFLTCQDLFVGQFGNIQVETDGSGDAGSIQLVANSLEMADGGTISSKSWAEGAAGSIDITAEQTVLIHGQDRYYADHSGLSTSGRDGSITLSCQELIISDNGQIESDATLSGGSAGDIELTVNTLDISDGGRISCNASGSGDAGSIDIVAAGDVSIQGSSWDGWFRQTSGLFADTSSSGQGGEITMTCQNLTIGESGRIQTITNKGSGDAGQIQLTVDSLNLIEGGQINSNSQGEGAAGAITVSAAMEVLIQGEDANGDNSGLYANTSGNGEGGEINVTCEELTVGEFGRIQTRTTSGSGDGGHIHIDVGSLDLIDGGQISSSTWGQGTAGDVDIMAENGISIQGEDPDGYNSGLYANTYEDGAGGQITVTCPNLSIEEYGRIQTLSQGSGNAGQIHLDVDTLDVADGGRVSSSTSGDGAAGDIHIAAADFVAISGVDSTGLASGLIVDTQAAGTGGNIHVQTQSLNMQTDAVISATTSDTGEGGNISIQAAEDVLLDTGALISGQSLGTGNAGTIDISAGHAIAVTGQSAILTSAAQADGGNIDIESGLLLYLLDSDITTSVGGGSGNGGNIYIDPVFMILDGSHVIANAYGGNGGNIDITADYFWASWPDSQVQASSELGIDGSINIDAPQSDISGGLVTLSTNFLDIGSLLYDTCAAREFEDTSSLEVLGGGRAAFDTGEYMAPDWSRGIIEK